jgi:tRNA modification GTPase
VLSDPIVALATPPGRSAIALIRLSGRGAFALAARCLAPFRSDPARVVTRATLHHPANGEPIDEVLAVCFPEPHSYTGEDLVEISTHGGLLVPADALAALVVAGARLAEPGEFTRRAVFNGKMDLLQAEATADLIDAGSPAQRRRALQQLDRGLSQRLADLREEILELEALIALGEEARLSLALSSVVESAQGELSYWALRHPAGKPDFHHPDSFALELDEVRR